jgi:hypothetical protein
MESSLRGDRLWHTSPQLLRDTASRIGDQRKLRTTASAAALNEASGQDG